MYSANATLSISHDKKKKRVFCVFVMVQYLTYFDKAIRIDLVNNKSSCYKYESFL